MSLTMPHENATLHNWDPLTTLSSFDAEIYSASVKRQIKNILKSYTGWYDPMSEIIQNSLDAIENRMKVDQFNPKIWIRIDLQQQIFAVTDNGIGFSENQFRLFLAPNVSFKNQQDDTRGNKGVGATYMGYGFNFLQIGTRTPEFSYLGSLKNGRNWVEDSEGVIARPTLMREEKSIHSTFDDLDRGSTCALKFVGENIRPKNLGYVGATTAQQWAVVLRLKTPIGGIYLSDENRAIKQIACEVEVIQECGTIDKVTLEDCTYLYPHEVISQSKNLKDIEELEKKLISQGRPPVLPAQYSKLNGVYGFWNTKSITEKILADTEQKQLAQKYHVECYAFFCYSTNVWDTYNDDSVGLRKGNRILRGGLQLATNSMPQGELFVIPLNRNVSYQNNAHVVVHFKDADPDLGRKGFQPELEELAKRISVQVVQNLSNRRLHLKQDTGAPPDIISQSKVYEWINRQVEHEKAKPLIINREDVFIPTLRPSLTSQPLNEQDVIALFNQLLAGGVIRGLKVMSTDQHQQYDGIYKIQQRKPFELLAFDGNHNPLGVPSITLSQEFEGPPQILEYKFSVDALVDEIEQEVKREQDIKLVVAWTLGSKWKSRYQITSLLDTNNLQHRPFHGCTHVFYNSATMSQICYAVILEELIDYINNVDEVQSYHQDKYSI